MSLMIGLILYCKEKDNRSTQEMLAYTGSLFAGSIACTGAGILLAVFLSSLLILKDLGLLTELQLHQKLQRMPAHISITQSLLVFGTVCQQVLSLDQVSLSLFIKN